MNIRKLTVLFSALVFGVFALIGIVAADTDATIQVNSTLDEPMKTGSNACLSTPSNVCTLRAAVMLANLVPGKDRIQIPAGTYNLTRTGTPDDNAVRGDLDVVDDVEIVGAGRGITFIDGKNNDRIFDLLPSTRVKLSSMTLRNGFGGVEGGSAIRARGYETQLEYLIVKNNKNGAAIQNAQGDMYLYRTVVQDNEYGTNPGAGGISTEGALIIDQSLIYNNRGFQGGGIFASSSTILINSTLSGNKADYRGGAIEFGNSSQVILLDLSNVTITNNRANLGDQYTSGGAGGIMKWDTNDVVQVRNSIIAGNIDEGLPNNTVYSANDCHGNFSSDGFNIIGDNQNCSGFVNGVKNDKVGTLASPFNPKLNALANNGGFIHTHSLQAGSAAIDGGNTLGCKDRFGTLLTRDQRGFARPVNGGSGHLFCDIGAHEQDSPGFPTATPSPTPTLAPCSEKPEAATLDIPVNGSEVTKRKVALDWTGKICTTHYKVIVKQGSKKGPKVDGKSVQPSSFITKKLPKGHTYYWRVKACNDFGCKPSTWFTFTILP